MKQNAEIVKIFSLVFCMSEFKSDRALQSPYNARKKNQVGFASSVLVVVGVGTKICEMRRNM